VEKSFQTIIPDREEKKQLYRILTVVRVAAPGAPERADAPGEAKKIGRERLFLYVQRGRETEGGKRRVQKRVWAVGAKKPSTVSSAQGLFSHLGDGTSRA
jgi:hypothetical protein